MINFNINDFVYFQITEDGWKYLRTRPLYDFLMDYITRNKVQIDMKDNEDWYGLQCYELFSIFPIKLGSNFLIKPNMLLDKTLHK